MKLTPERLRRVMLAATVVLMVVLVAIFVGRRVGRRLWDRDLPANLGIQIQQSTNGFTISKSQSGKTLFTLHASKAIQFKNGGKAQLHDVSITLYGRGSADREDRIYGDVFDYDPSTGIAQADGVVEMDLEAPSKLTPGSGAPGAAAAEDRSTVHVKSIGMTFDQKTGIASTDGAIEFRMPKAAGRSRGATYDSSKGELLLHSDVHLDSSIAAAPALLIANSASFERDANSLEFFGADYRGSGNQLKADKAIATMRQDGSIEHVTATGNVQVATDSDQQISSPAGEAFLDEDSRIQRVHMEGGVQFHGGARSTTLPKPPPPQLDGSAQQMWLQFDDDAQPALLDLRGAVEATERVDQAGASETRRLTGEHVTMRLASMNGKTQARELSAEGSPSVIERRQAVGQPLETDQMFAQQFHLALLPGNVPKDLHGTGGTKLVQSVAGRGEGTSEGDELDVLFSDGAKPSTQSKPGSGSQLQIATAVQQGHVQIVSTNVGGSSNLLKPTAHSAAKPTSNASPEKQPQTDTWKAFADRAEYQGATQTTVLSGTPSVEDSSLRVTADRILLERATGNASAIGNVKGTRLADNGAGASLAGPSLAGGHEPVHVIGQHADLMRATNEAIFRGEARLWQAGNSVSAPTIEIFQTGQILHASGPVVHTVFVSQAASSAGAAASAHTPPAVAGAGQPSRSPTLVSSKDLLYDGVKRRAHFTGRVLVQNADSQIDADAADLFLAAGSEQNPAQNSAQNPAQNLPEGHLDHLTATGNVVLRQPGRQGTGDTLLYTASDGLFTLTGTPGRPPHMEDAERGSITGDSLIFMSRNDRVEVEGGDRRTVTNTRVQK